jgi:beta,beta-carotene 9',10'-dioxygenase
MADLRTRTGATSFTLGFTSLENETAKVRLPVQGALPEWLGGSLIRTGPTKFEVGDRTYEHWFDGLAMLHSFAIERGSVTYANRFLRSKAYCEATKTGEITHSEFMTDPCRTLFGRVMAVFNPAPTDNGCVNVAVLAGQMVALTESPLPVRFDPQTLATLGPLDYDASVQGKVSTAHPHHDGKRGYSYNIAMGRKSSYRVFVDENGTQRLLAEVPTDRPAYMHSFGMSERFVVLMEFPLRVNPLRLALSVAPFIRNYRWSPELGTLITVIDKTDGTIVARARGAPCFAFHHVNAFEADGALHVDLLTRPDADVIERLRLARLRSGEPVDATARLTRFSVPLGHAGNGEPVEARREALCQTTLELPRIDYARRAGRPHRMVWGAGQSEPGNFFDNITKIELHHGREPNVKTWHAPGCHPGEPVFVARPGGSAEDDGVLLSVVLDAGQARSFLLVLDAASLSEVARATVPHHIPFGFHGNHYPDPARSDAVVGAGER